MHKIGEARKQVDYECDVNSDEIRQRMKGAMISCMRVSFLWNYRYQLQPDRSSCRPLG